MIFRLEVYEELTSSLNILNDTLQIHGRSKNDVISWADLAIVSGQYRAYILYDLNGNTLHSNSGDSDK